MDYFEESKEISKELNNFLLDLYKNDEFISKVINIYTSKNIHLNGVQFVGGFIAGDSTMGEFKKYYIVPIILELTMLWAYRTNQIVDEKKEVWKDKDSLKRCVIDHDMILILIFDLLEKSKSILGDKYNRLDDIVKYLISHLLKGYDIEKFKLNIFENDLAFILENWEENYKKRNQYFDFVYDYAPLVGFWLASGDYSIFDKYKSYLLDNNTFGGFGQIVNDIGDWSISPDTKVKVYQDKFADLRNGIITFPVYSFIEDQDIKDALKDPSITFNTEWQIRVSKKSILLLPKIKKEGKKLFKVINNFWKENSINGDIQFLMHTYLIIKMSKYLHEDQYLQKEES